MRLPRRLEGLARARTRETADDVAPIPVEVPAGHAVMHHADVLHASGPNRTGSWRVAWVGVFAAC